MKRILCGLLVCLLLAGCTASSPAKGQTLYAMNTVMDMQFWGKDADAAAGQVTELIKALETQWSVTDYCSALYEDGLTDVQKALLQRAEALSSRTGGAFHPKLRSVSALWGFYNEEYREADYMLPTQPEIAAALADPQWDLGGILKGYAGEEAAALLDAMELDCALLNLGGNIQTYGTKPDGSPWQIALQDPNGGNYLGILTVEGTMAVVTSGDYQRYFEMDGIKYHHILDPKTGYPADSGLRSVTVLSKSGTVADALSTGLFVMGLEQGAALWRASDDFEAVFVLTDGRICATEGVVLTGCEYEVIARED